MYPFPLIIFHSFQCLRVFYSARLAVTGEEHDLTVKLGKPLQRAFQRYGISARKVVPSESLGKYRVTADEGVFPQKCHGAARVSGQMKYSQIFVADGYLVALAKQTLRALKRFRTSDDVGGEIEVRGGEKLGIIREIRARLIKDEGNSAAGGVMSMVMKDRSRFHNLLKFVKFSQAPVTTKGGRFIRHLPTILTGGDQTFRQLPALAPKSFRQLFKSVVKNPSNPKFTVGIFSGCAQDFIYPEQLVAGVRVLNKLGVAVEFPEKQSCCGLPLEMMGQRDTSLEVSSQNVNGFEPGKYHAIITLCASCAAHLKHGYPELLKGTEDEFRTKIFASKVMNFSDFIYKNFDLKAEDFQPTSSKVCYHSPCHLRNSGIVNEPRELLKLAANYTPATEEDSCCGFGGTFSMKFPELAAEIGRKKIANGEASGADIMITDCPGCIMQLRGVATAKDSALKVEHMAELLARTLIR